MATSTTRTNKPIIPRGQDASPLKYNRAALYSGKALDFDGVNDSVSVADNANLSFGNGTTDSPFSITGYFNLDVLGTNKTIAAKDNGSQREYALFVTSDNKLRFFLKNNGGSPQQSIDSDLVLESGKWYFVAATYDGRGGNTAWQGLNIYVNAQLTGVDSNIANTYTAMANTTADFAVGVYASTYMNGQISNIKVFSGELTAAQVSDLYNNPEKIVPTGVDNTALKLWLPMMEGAGTTAYDGSGNGNHGTISGATYVNGVGAPVAQSAVMDWNKGSNLVVKSEFSDLSPYFLQNVGVTLDGSIAPDLSTNATKVIAFSGDTFHLVNQTTSSASAGIYTQSIFAKANEYDHIYMVIRTDGGANRYGVKFDLTNGEFVDDETLGTPTNTGYSITSAGNGWWRCSATLEHTSGNVISVFGPSPSGLITGGINNTFDPGTSQPSIYVWGLQTEAESSVGAYIPNHTGTPITTPVLLPQGLTSGRDITGVNLFENVRKQGALNLDGNSWAEVHDNASFDFGTAVSLEAWVYWQGDNDDDGILGRYGTSTNRDFSLYAYSAGIQFYVSTNAVSYLSMTNGWRHIVGTYDGANKRLYVDGVQVNSSAETATLPGGSIPIEIGRYNQSAATTFTQPIAQPRIYNRALTAEEVQRNYDAGKNIYTNS